MKKINLLTLAFAILVPMLFASCNSKEDLVGEYELGKKDVEKLFSDKDFKGESVKLSLNKDDSFEFSVTMKPSNSAGLGDGVDMEMEVEFSGKWDFAGIGDELSLDIKKADIKKFDYKIGGESMPDEMKEQFKKEALKNFDVDDMNKEIKGKALKVTKIDDDGFTVEGEKNGEVKFKKV